MKRISMLAAIATIAAATPISRIGTTERPKIATITG